MRPIDLVLAHHIDPSAEVLARHLRREFRNVAVIQFSTEIRGAVARLRAPVSLVDLELVSLQELSQLCSDFPATAFVAIHRLADDQMWSDALAAGAADCCQSNDISSLLLAADRCAATVRRRVAAA